MLKKNSNTLYANLAAIIEQEKKQVTIQVNSTLTLVWKIGNKINEHVLQNKRADYGKEIISTLSGQLAKQFGKVFKKRIRRKITFHFNRNKRTFRKKTIKIKV